MRFCALTGVEFPICQAGMGFIAQGKLAAAVSAAGGLGVIGAEGLSLDTLREQIRLEQSRVNPIGTNQSRLYDGGG